MSDKVTLEMLQDGADRYNQLIWNRRAGRFYFVRREPKGDGTFKHSIDWSQR